MDGERNPEGRQRVEVEAIGRALLMVGLVVAGVGGVLLVISRVPGLNQLFNLPGDIRVQAGNLTCLFPIVSMIVLSVLLTVIVNIILRILNR
jgi:hypothetical protein